MPYVPHSQWSRYGPKRVTPHPMTTRDQPVTEIVMHHSVTPARPFLNMCQQIEAQHHRGAYSDIAYNGLVANEAPMYTEGRGPTVQGGATGNGFDRVSLSICAVGDFHTRGKDAPTDLLIANIVALLARWESQGHVARRINVTAHREHYATACCGDRLIPLLETIERRHNGTPTHGAEDVIPFEEWRTHYNDTPNGAPPDGVVEYVQDRLTRLGYDPGDVDGIKGPKTNNAVTQWKGDNDHREDDRFGRPAWDGFLEPVPGDDTADISAELSSAAANLRAATADVARARFMLGQL